MSVPSSHRIEYAPRNRPPMTNTAARKVGSAASGHSGGWRRRNQNPEKTCQAPAPARRRTPGRGLATYTMGPEGGAPAGGVPAGGPSMPSTSNSPVTAQDYQV